MLCSLGLFVALGASIAIQSVSAFGNHQFKKRAPFEPRQDATANQYSTEYWFDQLLDHTNPAAGTFKQRYFFSDQYYKGQGAPIILGTPGEQSADGFYTDLTGYGMMHTMMQSHGAAGVVLEHRYWGKSSPYDTLTAPNLQYLTVDQAIDDYKYFIENAKLPWTTGVYTSDPGSTPWVNTGCSYPGLLVAYTQEKYPDLFAAGYATSAPVNADGDFWEYWEPVEEGMPKNCSSDLAAAIAYIDTTLSTGTPEAVTELKTKFGMENVAANDDFGAALIYPLGTWQDMQAYSYAKEGTPLFYKFCDAIETNADGTYNQNAQGVGLPLALDNWASAFKALGPDTNCPGIGGACYSSTDPTSQQYTDTSVSDQWSRAWVWLLCTQLGWFQVGDPGNSSSIVSSLVTPAHFQQECAYYFPLADGTHSTYDFSQDVTVINTQFKGWNVVGNNLHVVNGEFDPWRSASLSSKWAPSFVDTPTQDITLIPNAHHCWDFYMVNGDLDPNVRAVQTDGVSKIHGWLLNWYSSHPNVANPNTGSTTGTDDPNVASTAGTDDENVNNVNNTITDTNNNNNTSVFDELKNKADELASNKKLAIASFVVNGILLILVITCVVLIILTKRKASRSSKSYGVPKWSTGRDIGEGDQLGEYGSGSRAGGRGQYQQLKEQH